MRRTPVRFRPVRHHRRGGPATGGVGVERRRERLRYRRELNLCAPPAMIAAATERRLAGDWRGACAAALVEVDLDLRAVASSYGAAHAERIEAELTGFAP